MPQHMLSIILRTIYIAVVSPLDVMPYGYDRLYQAQATSKTSKTRKENKADITAPPLALVTVYRTDLYPTAHRADFTLRLCHTYRYMLPLCVVHGARHNRYIKATANIKKQSPKSNSGTPR